jgi:hypothetical protein
VSRITTFAEPSPDNGYVAVKVSNRFSNPMDPLVKAYTVGHGEENPYFTVVIMHTGQI